jgi:hypothetical protein
MIGAPQVEKTLHGRNSGTRYGGRFAQATMIFLGIDCGTQSTKTISFDWETGAVLASAQQACGLVPDTLHTNKLL